MDQLIEVVVKVAIIGAGISGIGSSGEFSRNGVEHAIIEARNRTGGRITSIVFDGATVQLGAELIHQTQKVNPIFTIVKDEKWDYDKTLLFHNFSFYEPGVGQLSNGDFNQASTINADLEKQAKRNVDFGTVQKSVQQVVDEYFGTLQRDDAAVDIAKWLAAFVGLYNGADLKDLDEYNLYDSYLKLPGIYVKGGYANFIQSIYSKTTPKNVYLNHVVTKIDYSGDRVKIYAGNKVFVAEKAIVTLPLGVLRQNSVEFVPALSEQRKNATKTLGSGVFNKVFVSFETPFWDTTKKTLGFVKKNGKSRYLFARYIPDNGKHILSFFISGSDSIDQMKMTTQQKKADIVNFLLEFYPTANIVIKDFFATSWQEDPLALMSYSFEEIGTNSQQLINTICEPLNNKVWFSGEHCHPTEFSYSHSAYQTGVWAAGNITQLLSA